MVVVEMKQKSQINILSLLTPKQFTFFVSDDISIRAFLEKADYHKFTVVPVLDEDGKYIGSLSEGDILRYIKNVAGFSLENAEGTSIREVERYRSYTAARISVDIEEVLTLLLSQNFVPLVDDRGVFIGIIKRSSVLGKLRLGNELVWKEGENRK